MENCKDCKFWRKHEDQPVAGECEKVSFMGNPFGITARIVADGSFTYNPTLETSPEFGCTMFLPRENQEC